MQFPFKIADWILSIQKPGNSDWTQIKEKGKERHQRMLRCIFFGTETDVDSQKSAFMFGPFFLHSNEKIGRKKFVLGFDRGGLRPRLWIQNATILLLLLLLLLLLCIIEKV